MHNSGIGSREAMDSAMTPCLLKMEGSANMLTKFKSSYCKMYLALVKEVNTNNTVTIDGLNLFYFVL